MSDVIPQVVMAYLADFPSSNIRFSMVCAIRAAYRIRGYKGAN